mmetsp:Transcript_66369/g.191603  ORF Transcript_66369/g.191603 Transcript_66369/m.191603 type:complete len:226 (-) Transcript_66369:305-982(-)
MRDHLACNLGGPAALGGRRRGRIVEEVEDHHSVLVHRRRHQLRRAPRAVATGAATAASRSGPLLRPALASAALLAAAVGLLPLAAARSTPLLGWRALGAALGAAPGAALAAALAILLGAALGVALAALAFPAAARPPTSLLAFVAFVTPIVTSGGGLSSIVLLCAVGVVALASAVPTTTVPVPLLGLLSPSTRGGFASSLVSFCRSLRAASTSTSTALWRFPVVS